MKRSRLCAALLCGAIGAALVTTPAFAAAPNDLRHHWAQAQVYTLMEHGIIAGYPDHTFRPDNSITREEAAVLTLSLLKERGVTLDGTSSQTPSDETGDNPSQDIPQQVLDDMKEQGDLYAVQNSADSEEKQDTQDQEAAQDSENTEVSDLPSDSQETPDTEVEDPTPLPTYTDLDNCWAKDYIVTLQTNGVLPQDGTTLFHPLQNLTRGEAAQIMYNCISASGRTTSPSLR